MKIPGISPSTSFLVGIETRKSHWSKTSLTLCSCFKISVCKKFNIWKGAPWASLKSVDNEEKNKYWSRNTVSIATAVCSGIILFLRRPFHEKLKHSIRLKNIYYLSIFCSCWKSPSTSPISEDCFITSSYFWNFFPPFCCQQSTAIIFSGSARRTHIPYWPGFLTQRKMVDKNCLKHGKLQKVKRYTEPFFS